MRTCTLIIAAMLLISSYSQATNYVAIASGNFTNSTTWQSGLVPPVNLLSGDKITIPTGKNVVLNQNLVISSSTILELSGSGNLSGGAGYYLQFNSGILQGTGFLNVDSLSFLTPSNITYQGYITVNKLYTNGMTISMSPNKPLKVNNTIHIIGGILTVASGTLEMPTAGNVIIDGANITLTGGANMLTANKSFKITYQGNSTNTGSEIDYHVYDVDINVDPANTVTLSSDLIMEKTLTLRSGTLKTNTKLILSPTIKTLATGNGALQCDTSTLITIQGKATDTSRLRFTPGGNILQSFGINLAWNSTHNMVELLGDMVINRYFHMFSGAKLDLKRHTLQLTMTGANVPSGTDSHYIITEQGGKVIAVVEPFKTQVFGVGTYQHYAPVGILGAIGSPTNTMTVNVENGVLANGNIGVKMSNTQPTVDVTWNLASNLSSGLNMTLFVYWSIAMERNNFNRNKMYISHYNNSSWDSVAVDSAFWDTNYNLFGAMRQGITSLSPFGVFDENTAVSINSPVNVITSATIHPNPAGNSTNINLMLNNPKSICIIMSDMSGRVIYRSKPTLYSKGKSNINVPLQDIMSGIYNVAVADINGNTLWSGKLIHQ